MERYFLNGNINFILCLVSSGKSNALERQSKTLKGNCNCYESVKGSGPHRLFTFIVHFNDSFFNASLFSWSIPYSK